MDHSDSLYGTLTVEGHFRKLRHLLAPRPQAYGLAISIISQGPIQMDPTTTFSLVNSADTSKATRYTGFVDLANGTTPPTFTSSDETKLVCLVGAFTENGPTGKPGCPIFAYPVDTAVESADVVLGTISLAGQPDITLTFDISGEPPPPAETDALDPQASTVGSFTGAPAVPNPPV